MRLPSASRARVQPPVAPCDLPRLPRRLRSRPRPHVPHSAPSPGSLPPRPQLLPRPRVTLPCLPSRACLSSLQLLLSLLPGIRRQYLLLSVFGGAAHNVGQLIAARFIISNQYVWYYLPVLLAAGLLMGAITGMALRVVMPYLDRLSLK